MLPTLLNCDISRFDNLRSCVIYLFIFCFFGSREKKKSRKQITEIKGGGMLTDWRFDRFCEPLKL